MANPYHTTVPDFVLPSVTLSMFLSCVFLHTFLSDTVMVI